MKYQRYIAIQKPDIKPDIRMTDIRQQDVGRWIDRPTNKEEMVVLL